MATITKSVIVHLSPEMKAWVVARAAADGRSESNFVRDLLEKWARAEGARATYPEIKPREFLAAEDKPKGEGVDVSQFKLDAERAKGLLRTKHPSK